MLIPVREKFCITGSIFSMNNSFWQNLPKPFFALAPMADVTDPAFRIVVASCAKPDVLWTEFVSADGLAHPVAREKLIKDLQFTEAERPIVAQLFSSNPDTMRSAAQLCAELGFDGIDINMGCPDKTIEKQGCGAAMIKTPEVAKKIIQAAKQGAPNLPISVKTRVGYSAESIDTWIKMLLVQDIAVLSVHARTRSQLSKVAANWNYIKQIVELRDSVAPHTLIIGNGDVSDIAGGLEKATQTGCDGIMIGRAVFGNPWIFDKTRTVQKKGSWNMPWFVKWLPRSWAKKIVGDNKYTVLDIPLSEKLQTLIKHAELFENLLGDVKSFAVMKKHFKAYVHGFDGAKELRINLMDNGNSAAEVKSIIEKFLH